VILPFPPPAPRNSRRAISSRASTMPTSCSPIAPASAPSLRGLERTARHASPNPFPAHILDQIARDIDRSAAIVRSRLESLPRPRFDQPGIAELPVVQKRDEIAAAIRDHQVIILCCAPRGPVRRLTLPKICLELGRGVRGLIGHTQPRRIAARAVAARIAQELGTTVGETVGLRFASPIRSVSARTSNS